MEVKVMALTEKQKEYERRRNAWHYYLAMVRGQSHCYKAHKFKSVERLVPNATLMEEVDVAYYNSFKGFKMTVNN